MGQAFYKNYRNFVFLLCRIRDKEQGDKMIVDGCVCV